MALLQEPRRVVQDWAAPEQPREGRLRRRSRRRTKEGRQTPDPGTETDFDLDKGHGFRITAGSAPMFKFTQPFDNPQRHKEGLSCVISRSIAYRPSLTS